MAIYMPFQPGNTLGINGRPPSPFNMQNWKDRAAKICEKYEAYQIITLGNQIAAGKKKLLVDNVETYVSTLDSLIIVNLSSALQKDGKERERLLDRLLGKPVLRIGGEEPNKPIEIQTKTLSLESMDTDTLLELQALIRKAKTRITLDQYAAPSLPCPEKPDGE